MTGRASTTSSKSSVEVELVGVTGGQARSLGPLPPTISALVAAGSAFGCCARGRRGCTRG
jgi:hypothetical protein